MGGQLNAPSLFTAGKEKRYLLYRKLGRPRGRSGWMRKILLPLRFDPQTVQPVASCYTVYAIPAHLLPSDESQSTHALGETKIIVSCILIFTFFVFT